MISFEKVLGVLMFCMNAFHACVNAFHACVHVCET